MTRKRRAKAIVEATTHFNDADRIAAPRAARRSDAGDRDGRTRRRMAASPDAAVNQTDPFNRQFRPVRCRPAPDRRALQSRAASKGTSSMREAGAEPVEVRLPAELEALDGLILPGGESTTITMGIEKRAASQRGISPITRPAAGPPLGTCAGMIVASREHLGLIDITTVANALRPASFQLPGTTSQCSRGLSWSSSLRSFAWV